MVAIERYPNRGESERSRFMFLFVLPQTGKFRINFLIFYGIDTGIDPATSRQPNTEPNVYRLPEATPGSVHLDRPDFPGNSINSGGCPKIGGPVANAPESADCPIIIVKEPNDPSQLPLALSTIATPGRAPRACLIHNFEAAYCGAIALPSL